MPLIIAENRNTEGDGYLLDGNDDIAVEAGITVVSTAASGIATWAGAHVFTINGTVRGYDVMLVLRNDVVRVPSGKEKRCHWLIVTVDLHTKTDVPHCYVGHKSRDDEFAASYRQLHPLAIGGLGRYPHAFSSNYTVYGAATNALAIERTIPPQIAEVIAAHFQGVSIEIEDNMVYLYIESVRPTEAQLDAMLSNALWLAEAVDALYAPQPHN